MLRVTTNPAPVGRRPARAAVRAFTLIEIILAIALATGLLLVALMFYRQAATLRGQVLLESDRAADLRLTLDRLAGDLRAAQPNAAAGREFTGDSISMRFVKDAVDSPPRGGFGRGDRQETDLARVSVAAATRIATNGVLIVTGLNLREKPLSAPVATPFDDISTNFPSQPAEAADPVARTNRVERPLLDFIRFVRFRYWDGGAWQSGWTNAAPPPGVEIVLAADAAPDDLPPDAFPPEATRRVVFLPGGVAKPQTNDLTIVGTSSP